MKLSCLIYGFFFIFAFFSPFLVRGSVVPLYPEPFCLGRCRAACEEGERQWSGRVICQEYSHIYCCQNPTVPEIPNRLCPGRCKPACEEGERQWGSRVICQVYSNIYCCDKEE